MLALNIGLSLTSALVCTALLSGIQGAFTDIRTLSGGGRFDDFRCSWQRSRVSQRQEPKVLPSKHWSWHDWKKADKNGKKDLACNPTYFQAVMLAATEPLPPNAKVCDTGSPGWSIKFPLLDDCVS